MRKSGSHIKEAPRSFGLQDRERYVPQARGIWRVRRMSAPQLQRRGLLASRHSKAGGMTGKTGRLTATAVVATNVENQVTMRANVISDGTSDYRYYERVVCDLDRLATEECASAAKGGTMEGGEPSYGV
jgi:hypothetical protein